MKILFVGETWRGSSARSLREAMECLPGVELEDVGEDHYAPKADARWLRAAHRLLRPWHLAELQRAIVAAMAVSRPDVLMVFKGSGVSADTVRRARQAGVFTVNVFPDYSPHAYGDALKAAIGENDLVISAKPFHPAAWTDVYGYRNACVHVAHGYDPNVHLWSDPPGAQDFDLLLAATWRPEYHRVMVRLAAQLDSHPLRVGIIGNGWAPHRHQLPSHWELAPALPGRSYGHWLRRGRIVLAPVHTDVVVNGVRQPGDEDTTRTYELAAMGCFFLHRRTPFARRLYDEQTEVPMWDDADELAAQVLRYLPREEERRTMAARAHARAVPAYAIPTRAAEVLAHVTQHMHVRSEGVR